jgi:hypothetical protein
MAYMYIFDAVNQVLQGQIDFRCKRFLTRFAYVHVNGLDDLIFMIVDHIVQLSQLLFTVWQWACRPCVEESSLLGDNLKKNVSCRKKINGSREVHPAKR